MTRTLTNIDFSIVIIIGGYLVHIQYNVVSSDTKLYLFLRVVNKMENSEDDFMMKMTHDLQIRKCIQQRRYKWMCNNDFLRVITSLSPNFISSRHFLFNYTLYLYIGVAFASARTIEVAHGKYQEK